MPPTKGEIVEQLVLNMRLSGQASQPAGEPPQADVQGEAESVTVERGEGAGIDVVAYKTHVTFTGETSFTESGRISVGHNGDALMSARWARVTSRLRQTPQFSMGP